MPSAPWLLIPQKAPRTTRSLHRQPAPLPSSIHRRLPRLAALLHPTAHPSLEQAARFPPVERETVRYHRTPRRTRA